MAMVVLMPLAEPFHVHTKKRRHQKKKCYAAAAEAKKPNNVGDKRRKDDVSGGALAMGQVTLLRRGESLDSLATKIGGANPRHPIAEDQAAIRDPSDSEVSVTKKMCSPPPPQVHIYAGAAFESSPSPRFLPLPNFSIMKGGSKEVLDDGVARSLRLSPRLD